jgi:hypothetical protein
MDSIFSVVLKAQQEPHLEGEERKGGCERA